MMKTKNSHSLEWTTIEYEEILDTDGTLLELQYTHEAKYRGGYLVKHVYVQYTAGAGSAEKRTESMVFVRN